MRSAAGEDFEQFLTHQLFRIITVRSHKHVFTMLPEPALTLDQGRLHNPTLVVAAGAVPPCPGTSRRPMDFLCDQYYLYIPVSNPMSI